MGMSLGKFWRLKMIQEIKTYKTNDLVLEVSKSYNPINLDISAWDRFLEVLCGNREYQKEAIKNSIIYLASGKYNTIEDLIKENWNNTKKAEIKGRFKTIDEYISQVQLPGRLSANIDLATGTGKSYVIYGIAQIMLSLGLVDRVLVLCPSLTIERELKKKFVDLSSNAKLKATIPEDSKIMNPSIIDANNSIKVGDICIENIHAAYHGNSSSIRPSLSGCGERTLVLNDESHHIFNTISAKDQQSKDIKKWKEFLLDPEFKFKYILGFTGTAYIDNEYFNDVIYRYSLRKAVDSNIVKMIEYVSKDDSNNDYERFQKILDNHNQNKLTYSKIKPLSILITKDIRSANRLAESFKEFLMKVEGDSKEIVDSKVITVTSHPDHKLNVAKLPYVDDKNENTEWIISVAMLTEGWDVKNVFQIVPWEDKAFNSKLLIAQVLGRGLRIPPEYQSPQPKVKVFNHIAFSKNIRTLVDEILEIEMKLISNCVDISKRKDYNFKIYNINYDKEQQEKEAKKNSNTFDYTKGYIKLIAQVEHSPKETEYEDLNGKNTVKDTLISYDTYSIDEVVNKIYNELKIREWEGKILQLPQGSYTKDKLPPKDEIKTIIRTSMDMVGINGDKLVELNKQKVLTMFSTLLRKKSKTIVNSRIVTKPYDFSTLEIQQESLSVGNLRHDYTVFYSDNYESELPQEVYDILQAVIDDESFPKSSSKNINPHLFKTPVDLVFTKGEPERTFVQALCKKQNAALIESWIKSRNQGFYSIEYSITSSGGKHSTQPTFNPDFFIKINKDDFVYIVVVEIKSDNDDSLDNRAKLKYARTHFNNLNKELEKMGISQKYIFHFLSPVSYSVFFEYLRNGQLILGEFRSQLEDILEQSEL